jgi:hypothetical protein
LSEIVNRNQGEEIVNIENQEQLTAQVLKKD